MPEDRFRLVLDQIGNERMVFEADFPYYPASVLKAEVATVRQYCSDAQQIERILGSSLRRMLRLCPPAATESRNPEPACKTSRAGSVLPTLLQARPY